MRNLRVSVRLVNGGDQDFEYHSGKDLIESWFTDDWGPPPTFLEIKAKTEDGKTVMISIPYSADGEAFASVTNDRG